MIVLVRQAFTTEAVRSYAGLVEEVLRGYFQRWDDGQEIRAYNQCKDVAFDVATRVLLGMQLDVRQCLGEGLKQGREASCSTCSLTCLPCLILAGVFLAGKMVEEV